MEILNAITIHNSEINDAGELHTIRHTTTNLQGCVNYLQLCKFACTNAKSSKYASIRENAEMCIGSRRSSRYRRCRQFVAIG